MNDLFSPGSLITISGAVLTVIGGIAYLTGAANLSVPTLFYGFPIFIGGLALKTSELPPAKRVVPGKQFDQVSSEAPEELKKLVKDVTRWRYGQKAHLDSSLKALKLWDDENPPQLLEIEELTIGSDYGVRMRFELAGVPIERWQEKQARLGRFFAKGLNAEIKSPSPEEIDLILLPTQSEIETTSQHGVS